MLEKLIEFMPELWLIGLGLIVLFMLGYCLKQLYLWWKDRKGS